MDAGRREFVRVVVTFGAAAALGGCGSGAYDYGQDPGGGGGGGLGDCSMNGGKASSISANHGHSLSVPVADFTAGMDKTYSIQGAAAHDHLIALTGAQLASIAAGNAVTVVSDGVDHVHSVTCVCA